MSKIAVIDIGSNSVRMVIFDGLSRAPHYLYNEKAMCRLGAGLRETGKLSAEGVLAAKSELERFTFLARSMNVSALDAIATAAVREASDGAAFCDWVEKTLDLKIRVLSGEEEARISAQGVLLGWPDASGWISDMGGSSMELISVSNGEIGEGVSTRLGPLQIEALSADKRDEFIGAEFDRAEAKLGQNCDMIYLVGGSWRAFAKIDMLRRDYPFPILHEYIMTPEDIEATLAFMKDMKAEKLAELTGASMARLDVLPKASIVLEKLVRRFSPMRLAVSAYGLREGVLYDHMPGWMREADPLIAACEALEQEQARFAGYGRRLYDWLLPLREGNSAEEDRMALAACLLHDTNWRFHPDFRARISFEMMAQGNICGITHEERLFLALALASRYENNVAMTVSNRAVALISRETQDAARELGRAIRLGAMISGAVQELLELTALEIEGETLILRIGPSAAALYGKSVLKRLSSVGKIAKRDVEIRFN